MAKKAVSVTLGIDNLLWLRGQATGRRRASVSEVLDRLIAEVRASGKARLDAIRSVVGTIDIAGDDPTLERADAFLRARFEQSLARPGSRKAGRRSLAAATPRRGRKGQRRG